MLLFAPCYAHIINQTSDPAHPYNMLSLEELKKLTKDGALDDEEVVRVSYPVAECNDVVQECLEIMSLLIDVGVTHIELSEPLEKVGCLVESLISRRGFLLCLVHIRRISDPVDYSV